MTMPNERARALRLAGEILRKMLARDDMPENLRCLARVALRHYPDPRELEQMIGDIDRLPHGFLDQRWLAPEETVKDYATGTVSGNGARSRSTMTKNVRKAMQSAPESSKWGCVRPVGREFGSPDSVP